MALYFFHVFDGNAIREVTEAECSSRKAIRIRMLEAALNLAKKTKVQEAKWSLEVRNNRGTIVSMLDIVDYTPQLGAPTIRLF